ncbi:MAG: hypothetical protein R2941_05270 [Desulfobacterales bacterium]
MGNIHNCRYFRRVGFNYYKNEYIEEKHRFGMNPWKKLLRFAEKGNAKINLIEFTQSFIEIYMNETAKLAPEWINRFMASKRIECNDIKIHIELSQTVRQILTVKKNPHQSRIETGIGTDSSVTLNLLKEKKSDELYYYTKYEPHHSENPSPVINKEIRGICCFRELLE